MAAARHRSAALGRPVVEIAIDDRACEAQRTRDVCDRRPFCVQGDDGGVHRLPSRETLSALVLRALRCRTRWRGAAFALIHRIAWNICLAPLLWGSHQSGRRTLQVRSFVEKKCLKRVSKIVDHMPTVRDLDRLGSTARDAIGIQSCPVTRRYSEREVGLKPRGDALGRACGQQGDRAMTLYIADKGAVTPSLFVGPVINSHHRRLPGIREGRGTYQAQKRVRTGRHPQPLGQARACFTPNGEGDVLQRLPQPLTLACMRHDKSGQTLDKDTAWAGKGTTAEAPYVCGDHDLSSTKRKVDDRAVIV